LRYTNIFDWEILEVNITPFALKALCCSKRVLLEKGKSELCFDVGLCHDSCIWLPAFFSYFFQLFRVSVTRYLKLRLSGQVGFSR